MTVFSRRRIDWWSRFSRLRSRRTFAARIPAAAGQRARGGLASGLSGPSHYKEISADIAKLGYDVVLFDGNKEENTRGVRVKADIQRRWGCRTPCRARLPWWAFRSAAARRCFTAGRCAEQVAVGCAGSRPIRSSRMCRDSGTLARATVRVRRREGPFSQWLLHGRA